MKNITFIILLFNAISSFGQTINEEINHFFELFNKQEYSKALKYENSLLAYFRPYKDSSYIDVLYYTGIANEFVGNKVRAKELALESYTLTKKIISPVKTRYYRSINALANIYKLDADYSNANKYYLESWNSFEKNGVLTIADQITTRSNLAFSFLMTGNYESAIKYYNENLILISKSYGEVNLSYANDLELLANAKKNSGQFEPALKDYEEAKQIYYKLKGKTNLNSAYCSVNQADILSAINNKNTKLLSLKYFDEFENYFLTKIDTLNETYLIHRITHGICLNSIALDFKMNKDIDSSNFFLNESKTIFLSIVNSCKFKKQENSKNYIIALSGLGEIAEKQMKFQDAINYYQQVIEVLNNDKSSDNNSQLIYYRSRLGNSLIEKGELSKGKKILQNIENSLMEILQKDPIGAFGVLSNLSFMYMKNGDIQKQIEIEKICLEHGKEVYKGEINERVLISYSMLSNLFYNLKNVDSIIYHLEKAKNISNQLYGLNNLKYIELLVREIIYLCSLPLEEKHKQYIETLFKQFDLINEKNKINQDLINEVLVSKQTYYLNSNKLFNALSLQQNENIYKTVNDTLTTILLRTSEIENLTAIGKYYDAYKIGHELFLKYPKMSKVYLMKLVREFALLPMYNDFNDANLTLSLLKWSLELHKDEKLWKENPQILKQYIDQKIIYCNMLSKVNKLDDAINESQKCLDLIFKNFGETDPFIINVYHNLGLFYMLKNNPDEALKYFKKAKTSDDDIKLAECNISLGRFEVADQQILSYYNKIFGDFLNEINILSEKDFPYRKFSLVTEFFGLLNYAVFRAEENPKLLQYAINKWFFLNDLGLRKGRLYREIATKAGLLDNYENNLKEISRAVQLPKEFRLEENINIDELILNQRKLEMKIGEATEFFHFDNSINFIKQKLNKDQNYVFIIPFSFKNLKNTTSSNVVKKDGKYSYFVGSIEKSSSKINFKILENAEELSNEIYQNYLAYTRNPNKDYKDDVESYLNFFKPIEHFFQFNKTYFCGADVYTNINIESIYHPLKKQSILETYNITFLDALTSNFNENTKISFDKIELFGGVNYGDGSILSKKKNDYYKNNSVIGIETMVSSNNTLLILNVQPNLPSEKAGLKIGDEILEINGEKVDLKINSESYYLRKIRGIEGTNVKLKINRKSGNSNFEVSITRVVSSIAKPQKIFEYLPGTNSEILEIEKILKEKSKNQKIYTQNEGNETNLKNVNNPSILHIATHSFYNDPKNQNGIFTGIDPEDYYVSPFLFNGLVMSGTNDFYKNEMTLKKENGFVNGLEISLLSLKNTDLTVVSGCESGQGVHGIGEGVCGLKEAFFRAGVKNLILAKFKITDQATQEFFKIFYKDLIKTDNLELAFKNAKLEIIKKFGHPYYWSAFQLYKN